MAVHLQQKRTSRRWLAAASVLWFLMVLVVESDTGYGALTALGLDGLYFVVVGWWLLSLATLASTAFRQRRLAVARSLLVYPLVALLVVGASWLEHTHQAVLWRIKLDEVPLVSFAQRHQQRPRAAPATPADVGLFRIERVEVHDDTVWMVTQQDCGTFGDDCGLAYSPQGRPPYLSESSYGHLEGPWWIWHRSW